MSAMPGALTLRRASADDAAAFARILGDPAVYPGLMQMPHADEARLRQWLGEMSAPGKTDLLLLAERDGEALGSAGLHPAGASLRRRHAVSIGISVLGSAQRQGVGSALMAALCDYSDRWLAVLRMELTVYADNDRAIGLYRKFGFVEEGRMRGYAMRDGQYTEMVAMARFHPAPPSIGA